jgi:Predicted membrane protein
VAAEFGERNVANYHKNLLPNERVVYRVGLHYISMVYGVVWLGLMLIVVKYFYQLIPTLLLMLLAGWLTVGAIRELIRYFTTTYTITDQRLLIKTGWLKITTSEVFREKIEGVSSEQGIVGRILNYETVVVCGIGGTRVLLSPIASPIRFRDKIRNAY